VTVGAIAATSTDPNATGRTPDPDLRRAPYDASRSGAHLDMPGEAAGASGPGEQMEVARMQTDGAPTRVERAVVGVVRGEDVELTRGGAGVVVARHDVSMRQGGGGPIVAGGDVSFRQGGGGPVLARGNVTLEQGLVQTVVAAGGVTVGSRGFVGVALAPTVTVEPGGRVLLSVRQALAFGVAAGLVASAVIGLRSRRTR
jgi:hypothetical protein